MNSTTPSPTNGSDVIGFLKMQHQQLRGMFDEVASTSGPERAKALRALRRMLAIHEAAEEQVIHPAARRGLPGGELLIEHRLREEREAKRVLSELEQLEVDSPEFDRKLGELRTMILAHADAEEREEFERLPSWIDARRLARMRAMVVFAQKVAPTHPHAGIESAAANMLVGPFAAIIDRARDAISSKH
jgi:hemerythrin superfamily protein